MADLQTKDFRTLVREQVAAIQGKAAQLTDFSVGSILRAVVEAYSAVTLWLQGMILQVLQATRASTSQGLDLDTWMADYGVTRLPATIATGHVAFSRFTNTQRAIVPIGTTVQTNDGASNYKVTVDTTNTDYSAPDGGYVLASGISSIDVPVSALLAGSAANAIVGAISTITAAIPYVDTVANAVALTNGEDGETDAALRARFVAYIASLSKATEAAVAHAIASFDQALSFTFAENMTRAGGPHLGYFYVVIDDGTGSPTTDTINAVYSAIDAIRPIGSTFGVFAPTVVHANVAMTIATAAGYVHGTVATVVALAVTDYINALPLGAGLTWSSLIQVAYDASPGVVNVTAVTLNSGTSDVAGHPDTAIIAGTVVVT